MLIDWTSFKSFITNNQASIQESPESDDLHLLLSAHDNTLVYTCKLRLNSENHTDYINNYQANANQPLDKFKFENDKLKVVTAADVIIEDDKLPVNIYGCPNVDATFKILYSDTDITIPSGYTNLYQYSGAGVFYGGSFDFNSDYVRVKLVVDGNQVFALTLDEVEAIQSFSRGGCNDYGRQNINFVSKTSGNKFNIYFPHPIKYNASILIQAQRTRGSNKKQTQQIIYLTKES